jgi:hypothetical protein
MAYAMDLEHAAHRHYTDGVTLLGLKRFDNAGYHFGLAAECAIKQKLQEHGVPSNEVAMWKHFPEMRDLALQALAGRAAGPLSNVLARDSFMQSWNVKMRYAPNGSIDKKFTDRWKDDANEAFGLLLQ